MADEHGRDSIADVALALDAEQRFLALRVSMLANIGAYVGSDRNLLAPFNNMTLACGVYDFPAASVTVTGVLSNTNPTAPYRGAGRPEAAYVIERIIDDAARDLGLDRLALRRRNMLRPEALPHRTPLGLTYDCGDFPGNLDRALALADFAAFPGRRKASAGAGRLRGLGIANVIEHAGGVNVPEYAEIRLDEQGRATLLAGTKAQGQGHATMYRQIVGDVLGLEPDRIGFIEGDTDLVPFGMGTNSSRSVIVGGSAMLLAARKLLDKSRIIARHLLDHTEIDFAGGVFVAPSGQTLALCDIAAAAHTPRDLPPDIEPGLSASAMFAASREAFPTSAHVCEVEIDPLTGEVHLADYAVVDDVGRVVNPVGVRGQILGGIAQGLGQILLEEVRWDPGSGQLLTANLLTYGMPHAHHLCPVRIESRPTITGGNPIGAKGAGESGTVGALPAVMNAIADALAGQGVRHFDMPATPERIWLALGQPAPDGMTGAVAWTGTRPGNAA
jgi:carbon-monoxide dehydrogenase large subunit